MIILNFNKSIAMFFILTNDYLMPHMYEWVRFSLGAQFMRPCATSKQKA